MHTILRGKFLVPHHDGHIPRGSIVLYYREGMSSKRRDGGEVGSNFERGLMLVDCVPLL